MHEQTDLLVAFVLVAFAFTRAWPVRACATANKADAQSAFASILVRKNLR